MDEKEYSGLLTDDDYPSVSHWADSSPDKGGQREEGA